MRKVLFLSICLVALLAISSVSKADIYEMDTPTARLLRDMHWSDTETPTSNVIKYIGDNPGDLADRIYGSDLFYGSDEPMIFKVGFSGDLTDYSKDGVADVWIGLGTNVSSLPSGTYDSFVLPVANGDNQIWQYKLYAITTGDYGTEDYISTSWKTLVGGSSANLSLDFVGGLDFSTLTDLGLIIRLNQSEIHGYSDNFHTSVVPVPGAILLGLLGMSAAGIKLRRFA